MDGWTGQPTGGWTAAGQMEWRVVCSRATALSGRWTSFNYIPTRARARVYCSPIQNAAGCAAERNKKKNVACAREQLRIMDLDAMCSRTD